MPRHTTNINEMTLNDSLIIRASFEKMELSKEFQRFDYYLIDKWNDINGKINYDDVEEEDLLRLRKNAYHNFNRAYKGKHIANSRTIRKWFGIDEHVPPKRNMMYKIALTLGLSVEETEDYMVNGLMQPTFQINDYQEIIYMYGLNNHMSYERCSDMIQIFEKNMGGDLSYIQDNHTDKLMKSYEINKGLRPEEFLAWMLDNKTLFKGYSKTVLDYFILLRDEIVQYIKKDAAHELAILLKETNYEKWKNSGIDPEKNRDISDYIRHLKRSTTDKMDEEEFLSLRRCYNIAYGEKSNAELIREMYSIAENKNKYKTKITELKRDGISFMSDKYLSQLLNIGEQKAEWMRLRGRNAQLVAYDDEEECPDDIYEFICEYGKMPRNKSVGECRKVIDYNLRCKQQRCQLIGREDILPLIHYIVQKRYEKMYTEEKRVYNMEEARDYFVNTASAALLKCGMAPISERYRSDYLMLASFSREDMYSLNDMVEISVQV